MMRELLLRVGGALRKPSVWFRVLEILTKGWWAIALGWFFIGAFAWEFGLLAVLFWMFMFVVSILAVVLLVLGIGYTAYRGGEYFREKALHYRRMGR